MDSGYLAAGIDVAKRRVGGDSMRSMRSLLAVLAVCAPGVASAEEPSEPVKTAPTGGSPPVAPVAPPADAAELPVLSAPVIPMRTYLRLLDVPSVQDWAELEETMRALDAGEATRPIGELRASASGSTLPKAEPHYAWLKSLPPRRLSDGPERMKIAGIVVTGIGMFLGTIGTLLAVVGAASGWGHQDEPGGAFLILSGAGVFGWGFVLAAIGVPLWAVGQHRDRLQRHHVELLLRPSVDTRAQGGSVQLSFRF